MVAPTAKKGLMRSTTRAENDGLGEPGNKNAVPHRWRDRKRYLWLLAPVVPSMAVGSWLLVLGTGQHVFWWLGAIITFVVIPILDHLVGADSTNPPYGALAQLENDRFYRWVNFLYLPGQYASLVFACWIWANDWVDITLIDKLGLVVTVGIIGGIAISTAHELGHQRAGLERKLSKIALAQTCYGHFVVEHNRGHHVRVATPEDPASSLLGESLYAFIPRSVAGGSKSAWRIERERFVRTGTSHWSLRNHVLNAWLLSVAVFSVLAAWFGPQVLPWLVGQAIIGFCMLETINYIEHYGLRRQRLADGRYERIRPSHSWNSNTIVANVCLFHLQRHSDHHAHPLRRYQTLRHADEAPQLPSGYATMMLIAMVPPLWRRVMDSRVIQHYGGRVQLAALRPRYAQNYARRFDLPA
jgi:alkane 1-monooxygenase